VLFSESAFLPFIAREEAEKRETPMAPLPPPTSSHSPLPLSSSKGNNTFSSSSSSSSKIKAVSNKLSASATIDDWALLVAYEAEKERKQGARLRKNGNTMTEKPNLFVFFFLLLSFFLSSSFFLGKSF